MAFGENDQKCKIVRIYKPIVTTQTTDLTKVVEM